MAKIILKHSSREDLIALDKMQKLVFSGFTYNLKSLLELIDRDNFFVFNICNNDTIIGAVCIQNINDYTSEIYRIFISTNYQNKGYGSIVLKLIFDMFRNVVNFKIFTLKNSKQSIKFFKKNGFNLIGEKKDIYNNDYLEFLKTISRNALTGLKPSDGGLHLGHYIGNIEPMIRMQNIYNCSFIFANLQLLNVEKKYHNKEYVKRNMRFMLKQILALGADPQKIHFEIESDIKKESLEKFIVFSDFVTDSRIQRMPLLKNLKKNGAVKISLMIYPILQAFDFTVNDTDIIFSNAEYNKKIGKHSEAILDVKKAQEIFEELNDTERLAKTYYILAECYLNKNEDSIALEMVLKGLEISKRVSRQESVIKYTLLLIEIEIKKIAKKKYISIDEYDEIIGFVELPYKKALNVCIKNEDYTTKKRLKDSFKKLKRSINQKLKKGIKK